MNDLFYYMDDFIYYYAWLSIVVGILFIPVKSIYNAFCFSKKEHLERSLNNYHPIKSILKSLIFLYFLHLTTQNKEEIEQLKQRIDIVESTLLLSSESSQKTDPDTLSSIPSLNQ